MQETYVRSVFILKLNFTLAAMKCMSVCLLLCECVFAVVLSLICGCQMQIVWLCQKQINKLEIPICISHWNCVYENENCKNIEENGDCKWQHWAVAADYSRKIVLWIYLFLLFAVSVSMHVWSHFGQKQVRCARHCLHCENWCYCKCIFKWNFAIKVK